ncbi:MAG: hypothetical protein HWN68_15045, partial [Desulfobacterales bacterium]|nr:hypothetical protein [Desulfobacterales bacterium]
YQIVKDIWIRQAQGRLLSSLSVRPRVVCDPARFGDDETVIYYAETTNILDQKIGGQTSVVQVASDLMDMSNKHNNCPIVVEEDGVGGGVIDNLNAKGKAPKVFRANGKANNSERFGNQRAEAWFGMGKRFSDGLVEFRHKNMSRNDLTTLINQLTIPRYRLKNGRIFVENKDDIKKRLGGSPDRGDAYMLLDWSYDKVPSLIGDDIWWDEDEGVPSYEVMSVL